MEQNDINNGSKKPRKILKITPSEYENAEALHTNKLYWDKVFNGMNNSSSDIYEDSKRLLEVLPRHLYEKVCSSLDLPIITRESQEISKIEAHRGPRRLLKEPLLSYRKCLYIDREADSDTDVEICESEDEESALPNIHQVFLSKPEREQITWETHYLQSEREDEKSLIKKADDLTDRIAKEFCQYMKELGGDQQSHLFTPKAIKELFQIEFNTHIARSVMVIPKELPSIEEKIAIVTGNPDKSRYAAFEREMTKDLKAERKSDLMKAFGQSLPLRSQYHVPRNNTRKLWRSARHVPKDLVTLKTVWEGITNLRSVREYCRWMIDHPEHRKPPYLNNLGMFNPTVLDTKPTFMAKYRPLPAGTTADDNPAPIENIRRRLSQLGDSN